MISRGDIRWFRFEAPDKRRPVLVLGREDVLPSLAQVPVIPLSTQIRDLPWEVRLSIIDGLPGDCVLKPEWIKTVERTSLGPWDRDISRDALERGGHRVAGRARSLVTAQRSSPPQAVFRDLRQTLWREAKVK